MSAFSSTATMDAAEPLLGERVGLRRSRILLSLVLGALLIDGWAAYAIGGVPIQWLGSTGVWIGGALLVQTGRLPSLRGLWAFLLLGGVSVFISIFTWGSVTLPSRATLPYPAFVLLRHYEFATFLAMAVVVAQLSRRGYGPSLVKGLLLIAGVLSTFALYAYLAQIFGFWEPPRSRMGTGGQDFLTEGVRFSYSFHRASGSFREPSHLAQWIVPPLFLGWRCRGAMVGSARIAILVALALSGSMVGIMAATVGVLSVMLTSRGRPRGQALVRGIAVMGVITGAAAAFGIPFWSTIGERLSQFAGGGIEGTNRAYVAQYVQAHPPPPLGYGWGNSNVVFSSTRGLGLIPSHLNVLVNNYMSLGIIGVGLTGVALVGLLRRAVCVGAKDAPLLGGLLAWLVFLMGNSEVFPLQFGLVVGLVLSHGYSGEKRAGFLEHQGT